MKLTDDQALEYVKKFVRASAEFRRDYEPLWTRLIKEYANARSVKSNPLQRANLKLPYAFTIVETFAPQVMQIFLTEKPYLTVQGRRGATSLSAEQISSYFTYQLDRMEFTREFQSFIKCMSIYGTAIAKTNWDYRSETITKSVKSVDDLGLPSTKKVESTETTFDGPRFTNIDIFDFFPDPTTVRPGDIQSQIGCVHRVYRTYDQIKALEKKDGVGIYENLDKLKYNMKEFGTNSWENLGRGLDGWNRNSQSARVPNSNGNSRYKGKIELFEYWGKLPTMETGDGEYETDDEQYIITIANGDTLIRFQKSPLDYKFKPFIACPNYVVPNEFYGMGDIEVVLSLIKEGTSLRNARLDQANQAVNRMWIVDRNGGINLRNLYSRSGGIILTNDMNGIKELNPPEVPGSGYKETSQIDFDIQNATAMINPSQATSGLGRAFGQTTGGVDYLKSFTAGRLGLKVKNIEDWVMAPLGKQLLLYNRQFVREKQWTYLFGQEAREPWSEMDPYIFNQEFDYFVTGAIERMGKQERQQQFSAVIVPFLETIEKYQPNTLKLDGIAQRFFKEFDYKYTDELINTPEQRQQITQQQQDAQQQAQLQQLQLQQQSQAAIAAQDQESKLQREAVSGVNRAKIQVVKGMFDVATAKAKDQGKKEEGARSSATGS